MPKTIHLIKELGFDTSTKARLYSSKYFLLFMFWSFLLLFMSFGFN